MTDIPTTIRGELIARGYAITDAEHDVHLVSLGVNSPALVQLLSALEDAFDIELNTERLFAAAVTVARLAEEIQRCADEVAR